MSGYYVLDDQNNVVPSSASECFEWKHYNEDRRRVGKTQIGDAFVSTVFLGMDHGWGGELEVFETMVFGGDRDGEQWRYATWDDAKAGHDKVVAELQEAAK